MHNAWKEVTQFHVNATNALFFHFLQVLLSEGDDRPDVKGPSDGDWWFCVQVSSNGKSWQVRRSLDNFQMLDRQLHRCVYDRKFSLLKEITVQPQEQEVSLIFIQLLNFSLKIVQIFSP